MLACLECEPGDYLPDIPSYQMSGFVSSGGIVLMAIAPFANVQFLGASLTYMMVRDMYKSVQTCCAWALVSRFRLQYMVSNFVPRSSLLNKLHQLAFVTAVSVDKRPGDSIG